MRSKAIVLSTILFALVLCMNAYAQITVTEIQRTVSCESYVPYDPATHLVESCVEAGPWSVDILLEGSGSAAAAQISDLIVDEQFANLIADFQSTVVRGDSPDEVLGASSSLNSQMAVTEPSVVRLRGDLGSGAGFFFGAVSGGFFHEMELAGSFDVSEDLMPGDTCFLNLWASATTPEAGVESMTGSANIHLSIKPEWAVSTNSRSWGAIKSLFR